MNAIYQLLNPSNTLTVNRLLAHALGTNEAIIYACLISKFYYYSERDMLNDGWFYSTAPDLQESSTLTERQQKKAVDNLVRAGLVMCELRGMPAKRSFYIIENVTRISELIAEGEAKAAQIKPAAAEVYEKKRQTNETQPTKEHQDFMSFLSQAFGGENGQRFSTVSTLSTADNEAVSPCSDKMLEQAQHKGQTLLQQNVGASSNESAEHTFNHNINKPNIIKSHQSIYPASESTSGELLDDRIDRIGFSQQRVSSLADEREAYRELIYSNIDYEAIVENSSSRKKQVDEIVDIMLDVICSTKPYIRANGEEYPKEVVKSQFLKLNGEHIDYVLTALDKTPSDIRNIRAYLITALYNAPMTIDNYYSAWVNHDMHG